jgi:hypothetical protein
MKPKLDPAYWEDRYRSGNTPWDLGSPSPSLVHLLEQHTTPADRILIPGAGHAYEAQWLHRNGYEHVYVCDWAATAIQRFAQHFPEFPGEHLLVQNFFDLELEVDFMLEQTFFCALDPSLRSNYVQKTHQLLSPGGQVGGLLFGVEMPGDGPPYGGSKEEYLDLFSNHFEIIQLKISPFSIAPRAGSELIFHFRKKAAF